MTSDRPADGSRPDRSLFEAFPEPLVAYATEAERSESEASAGGPCERGDVVVCRAVNPAFESAFDASADGLAGRPLDEVELRGTVGDSPAEATADAARPTTTLGSILDDLSGQSSATARLRDDSGDALREFRVRAFGDDPGCEGYLLFADVTDLAARRRDLATEVEQLERIAAVVSHDLRNPLEVATIRLEAARESGEDVHFEKVAGALDRIEGIVGDVLAVGGGSVDPTDSVSLADVAAAAWDTVDTADATLVTARDLSTVRGDADRLQQLFENLFRNAVEHGGSDASVTVEPVPNGFAVADDGPGVPDSVRASVFEAGYSTDAGNSGLGLSIVRRIAREHGWEVTLAARSDGGEAGARFEFTGVDRVEDGDAA